MNNNHKKKKHPILTSIAVILVLRSCFNSAFSSSKPETANETEVTSISTHNSSYLEQHVDTTASNDISSGNDIGYLLNNYVEIAGTPVIEPVELNETETLTQSTTEYVVSNVDPFTAVENAIAVKAESVTVPYSGTPIDWSDILSMSYGSFWLESYSYSLYTSNNVDYADYYFDYYDLSDSDITYMKAQMDDRLYYIRSMIPDGISDWEKVKIVHDILVSEISYDYSFNRLYRHNAYGGLVYGYAICSGYASTLSFVLNSIGIPCQIVSSPSHSFNKIGSTYVDLCWDDEDCSDDYGNSYIYYYYFGLNEDEITSYTDHNITYISPLHASNDYIVPNYYAYLGCVHSQYDMNAVTAALCTQYQRGANVLTIDFDNYDAYLSSMDQFPNDTWTILNRLGYTGGNCWIVQNDITMSWSIGLGNWHSNNQ